MPNIIHSPRELAILAVEFHGWYERLKAERDERYREILHSITVNHTGARKRGKNNNLVNKGDYTARAEDAGRFLDENLQAAAELWWSEKLQQLDKDNSHTDMSNTSEDRSDMGESSSLSESGDEWTPQLNQPPPSRTESPRIDNELDHNLKRPAHRHTSTDEGGGIGDHSPWAFQEKFVGHNAPESVLQQAQEEGVDEYFESADMTSQYAGEYPRGGPHKLAPFRMPYLSPLGPADVNLTTQAYDKEFVQFDFPLRKQMLQDFHREAYKADIRFVQRVYDNRLHRDERFQLLKEHKRNMEELMKQKEMVMRDKQHEWMAEKRAEIMRSRSSTRIAKRQKVPNLRPTKPKAEEAEEERINGGGPRRRAGQDTLPIPQRRTPRTSSMNADFPVPRALRREFSHGDVGQPHRDPAHEPRSFTPKPWAPTSDERVEIHDGTSWHGSELSPSTFEVGAIQSRNTDEVATKHNARERPLRGILKKQGRAKPVFIGEIDEDGYEGRRRNNIDPNYIHSSRGVFGARKMAPETPSVPEHWDSTSPTEYGDEDHLAQQPEDEPVQFFPDIDLDLDLDVSGEEQEPDGKDAPLHTQGENHQGLYIGRGYLEEYSDERPLPSRDLEYSGRTSAFSELGFGSNSYPNQSRDHFVQGSMSTARRQHSANVGRLTRSFEEKTRMARNNGKSKGKWQ